MSGPVGASLGNLRTRLSLMPAVSSILGVDTADEAADLIFLWAGPAYSTTPPPRIVLDATSLTSRRATTANMTGTMSAEMLVEVVIPTANAATEHDQMSWFINNVVDPLLVAVAEDIGANGGLDLLDWNMTLSPGRVEQEALPAAMDDSVVWIWQHSFGLMVL